VKPEEAKEIIKSLGLSGVQFSEIMNKNKNYVTDFNRYGVPRNIAIILGLCEELLNKNTSEEDILNILIKQGKPLDKYLKYDIIIPTKQKGEMK